MILFLQILFFLPSVIFLSVLSLFLYVSVYFHVVHILLIFSVDFLVYQDVLLLLAHYCPYDIHNPYVQDFYIRSLIYIHHILNPNQLYMPVRPILVNSYAAFNQSDIETVIYYSYLMIAYKIHKHSINQFFCNENKLIFLEAYYCMKILKYIYIIRIYNVENNTV